MHRGASCPHLNCGVGDVVGVAVSGGVGGSDGQEVVDTGSAQPHLVTGPAHQGTEVHLRLGSELHHALAGHHQHVRLLSMETIKVLRQV